MTKQTPNDAEKEDAFLGSAYLKYDVQSSYDVCEGRLAHSLGCFPRTCAQNGKVS